MDNDRLLMFVNGQAMSEGSIAVGLRSAQMLGPAKTSNNYNFYSFRDEFPGLKYTLFNGYSILGELYAVTYATLHEDLLPLEPPELELGVIKLSDGKGCLAMIIRDGFENSRGVRDISGEGGWRSYLKSKI